MDSTVTRLVLDDLLAENLDLRARVSDLEGDLAWATLALQQAIHGAHELTRQRDGATESLRLLRDELRALRTDAAA